MARLVLGTDKSVRIPAIVVEKPTPMPLSVQKVKDANGKVQNGSTVIDLDGATDIGDFVFYYEYYSTNNITGTVDFSSLVTISGSTACRSMFQNCTGITSINLSSLTQVSGNSACQNMFNSCTGITSVNLSSLTTITGGSGCSGMFSYCSALASVNLDSLNNIMGGQCLGQMFRACTSLTSLSFPALTSTSFGLYTNQFSNMLQNVTGCTVHFPSNLQAVIGSWSDVTAGFGGTSTTVLFDLPATN